MINDYIKIARPENWYKNAAILLGAGFAFYLYRPLPLEGCIRLLLVAFLSAFLISCSNYTINELVDANEDSHHPTKSSRPVPSGKVRVSAGYVQWFCLGLSGLGLAALEGRRFFLTALVFFIMGLVYNIKPVRAKDVIYMDVLTESLNSPIRFLLGWYAVRCSNFPPLILLMCFWMASASMMSIKRLAELKAINNPQTAALYRKTFLYYTFSRLKMCAIGYAGICAVFSIIFIFQYVHG